MSHIKINITAGLSLAVLLTSNAAVYAQVEQASPLTGHVVTSTNEDNAEAIKQRSGSGNPIAGREKSQLCQGCHGEFGISTEPLIPKLAGQYGNYIAKEVRDYEAGTRSHQIMNAMAGTLTSDKDLEDIAAYFASQPKMRGSRSSENPIGQQIFLHGDVSRLLLACVNCHGVNGKGLDPKISTFPVIGGQQKEYLRRQLMNFREGERTNSPNGIMNRVAGTLTDDEIEALVEYVSER